MARLTEADITEALRALPDWERSADEIVRTIRFPSFMDGIAFINRVAPLAEAMDRHTAEGAVLPMSNRC